MTIGKHFTNDKIFFAKPRGEERPRKPLRSLAEMADEFGVSLASLRSTLAHSTDNPPKPSLNMRNSSTGSRVYYEPQEMRAWWKRRNQKTES